MCTVIIILFCFLSDFFLGFWCIRTLWVDLKVLPVKFRSFWQFFCRPLNLLARLKTSGKSFQSFWIRNWFLSICSKDNYPNRKTCSISSWKHFEEKLHSPFFVITIFSPRFLYLNSRSLFFRCTALRRLKVPFSRFQNLFEIIISLYITNFLLAGCLDVKQ